ncbi:CDP-diacylglycerol--serine O-phosphatidyltransferase [Rufibacter glacialis]|uniref:CDP-diacylglycerol--serine O-phosphatidyltransferase n=1 Tax=Rufibacter glacialis TaxID=1259555 RepID=A0A5M8QQ29_9BACT|nr:CDP-diacylglycerol--serine O-phosphatidyltransferase [Rufibacter glacialis]KAA6437104.1 CDP-diacylglycerol--serine O-phosphatidyltransferase [Rufibacter glacialis]GGK62062.1 phosphatidylserine synthase [Rufibacter glacialis]
MKKHLPNFITCLNLLCGCLALVAVFQQELVSAAGWVVVAAALDFLDGLVARLLNTYSDIGKQLDSLADMVSFGVVPGAAMVQMISQANEAGGYDLPALLPYAGFLITIFSCIRLAKFNIDTRQISSFIGVPTPACTLFIMSLPLILANDDFGLSPIILNPFVLLGITVLFSYLLIAELPLFALKFKNTAWKGNEVRFIFMGLSILFLAILNFTAVPLNLAIYIILSFFNKSSSL